MLFEKRENPNQTLLPLQISEVLRKGSRMSANLQCCGESWFVLSCLSHGRADFSLFTWCMLLNYHWLLWKVVWGYKFLPRVQCLRLRIQWNTDQNKISNASTGVSWVVQVSVWALHICSLNTGLCLVNWCSLQQNCPAHIYLSICACEAFTEVFLHWTHQPASHCGSHWLLCMGLPQGQADWLFVLLIWVISLSFCLDFYFLFKNLVGQTVISGEGYMRENALQYKLFLVRTTHGCLHWFPEDWHKHQC